MRTWIQSRRFFVKILSVSIGLLLLLCMVFSVILYQNAQRSTTESISLTEIDRAGELLRQSTNSWRQLTSAASSFATLGVSYDNISIADSYYTRSVLDDMIQSHVTANSYTQNIDVFVSGNSIFPTQLSHDRLLGHFYFFDIYTEEKPSWPYSFDLITTYGNQFNKVVITVDAFYLSRVLFTFNDTKRMDFLLLEDDTILLSNHYTMLFQNIHQVLPDLVLEDSSSKRGTLDTYGEYYYVLTDEDGYGFRVLSLIPMATYSGQYSTAAKHTLMMSAGMLLVAIGISVFLTVFFYRPVKKTLDLLQTYVPEEIHAYENEISFIHQNIKKYVGGTNADAALPGTFSRIQSAQTAVLQHQINSHFLFNTLENIKAISITEMGADNEIENSIVLLNSIIHEGIFQKNLLVPLSHELHLARCYLELMQIRYADVDVQWSVDESLLQCQVFKFSLQPILENCFAHAFKGNLHRQKAIHIQVRRVGEDLSVLISDNGLGISTDVAMQLAQTLYAPGEATGSRHVGVRNIHQRITDTFGQKYGIRISDAFPGLSVEIRYPILIDPLS